MARAWPYRTPSIDVADGALGCARVMPRVSRGDELGWVQAVVGAVSAAKGLIKKDPKLREWKEKLDKFSVGKQLTRLIKGGGVSGAEKMWDAWRKEAMGKVPGPALEARDFEEAFKGMWDTNNRDFPGYARYKNDRERFKADLAELIVAAALQGTLTGSDTAPSVYTKLVAPWLATMKPGGIPEKRGDIRQLVIDLIDRYLYNLPIGRADMEAYQGGGYAPSIPLLSVSLEKAIGASSPATPESAPALPVPATSVPANVAPPAVPAPAPLPAVPTPADIEARAQQIAREILASSQGAALTAEQAAQAASATVAEWLKSQGVSRSSPQVQDAVQAGVASGVKGTDSLGLILGVAGLVATIAFSNSNSSGARRRRRRRK